MNLVLLGCPGSGKGTQAEILCKHFHMKKVSLGDILRQEADKGSNLGNTVSEYMGKGVLVPDEIIKEVIKNNLGEESFLLDGFPRNLNQADMLKDILSSKGLSLDRVIYLNVSEDVAVSRLTGRRICKNCGALYHKVTMPPEQDNKCDKCGSDLVMREDDKEETVKRRWQVYMNQTHALIEYYSKAGLLSEFDGNKDKESVFKAIIDNLGHGEDKES